MGLDIWFKDDIANILLAANEASLSAMQAQATSLETVELRAYRRGFVAALATIAQALGLPTQEGESREITRGTGKNSRRLLSGWRERV